MARHFSSIVCLAAAICSPAFADSGESLYARLGGVDTVNAFVNESVDQAAARPGVREALGQADLARLKTQLAQRICALAGGGCQAPAGGPQVAPFIETLRSSMRGHGIPLAARNELLEALLPVLREVARR